MKNELAGITKEAGCVSAYDYEGNCKQIINSYRNSF
jgi:hypothetical protein